MKPFQIFTLPKSIDGALKNLKTEDPVKWEKAGKKRVMELYKFVSKNVPAYRKLMKEHGIRPEDIQDTESFKRLPVIDKDSYLRKYDYLDLFPNRDLSKATTFSATSGSTGEPFFFPREEAHDEQNEYTGAIFLKNQFELDTKSTLAIISFGMGVWIGGILNYKYLNQIAKKGSKLAIVPVGTHVEIFLNTVKKFGKHYDQLLLIGYPPMIKDIIDRGKEYDISWKDYNIKILTAAEGYSEKFRDYLVKKAHIKNPLTDIINIYGTVELGGMGNETALTTLIRKIAQKNKKVFKTIFPNATTMPTLVQYHPNIVYFEEVNGELVASAYGSSIPLLRYRFPDRGGVVPFNGMIKRFESTGINILKEAREAGIAEYILKLPFAYVYERSDGAVSLVGADIYTQWFKDALFTEHVESFVTGKFRLFKKEDKKLNSYLDIYVELKKDISGNKEISEKIQKAVIDNLWKESIEFKNLYSTTPEKAVINVMLLPYSTGPYFKVGAKHKWV
jgi:phenylacetate-CoA ligase